MILEDDSTTPDSAPAGDQSDSPLVSDESDPLSSDSHFDSPFGVTVECLLAPECFRALIEPHLAGVATKAAMQVLPRWARRHFEDCRQHVALWLLEPENLARLARRYDSWTYGEAPDRLRAFLYPYARSEARHFLRKEVRHERRCRLGGERLLGLLDLAGGSPPDVELAHREEAALREALAARATLALGDLPVDHRIAFELVELHGMSKTAVAELRGRDRGTIASWVQKVASHLERTLSS